jgi:hypothetical protein
VTDAALPNCTIISSHFDEACGCTEEFYETKHGVLRLHVSKTGSVLDCSIGDTWEEDDQFCVITTQFPCRQTAYDAIVKAIPEENKHDWAYQ